MHEMQITEEIVKIAVEECKKHNISPDSIQVDVGNLTTYHEEPMMYYFELLKRTIPMLKDCNMQIAQVEGNDVKVRSIENKSLSQE